MYMYKKPELKQVTWLSLCSRTPESATLCGRTDLEFSLEFVEFFEHVLCCALHALRPQRSKLTNLPDVPVGIPLLCGLPHLLQVVYVLYKTYTQTKKHAQTQAQSRNVSVTRQASAIKTPLKCIATFWIWIQPGTFVSCQPLSLSCPVYYLKLYSSTSKTASKMLASFTHVASVYHNHNSHINLDNSMLGLWASDLFQRPDAFGGGLFYFEEAQPVNDGALFLF